MHAPETAKPIARPLHAAFTTGSVPLLPRCRVACWRPQVDQSSPADGDPPAVLPHHRPGATRGPPGRATGGGGPALLADGRPAIYLVRLDWREAAGPCPARAIAEQCWTGEPYWLQVDSHMRFAKGWDTKAVQQLCMAEAASAIGKAVLTTYPLPYTLAAARPGHADPSGRAALPPHDLPTLLTADRTGFQHAASGYACPSALRPRHRPPFPAPFGLPCPSGLPPPPLTRVAVPPLCRAPCFAERRRRTSRRANSCGCAAECCWLAGGGPRRRAGRRATGRRRRGRGRVAGR